MGAARELPLQCWGLVDVPSDRRAATLSLCVQIMHVLAAAAMWQLHLGASADYRTVAALQTGAASCPA